MTDQQKNEAVAKACGVKKQRQVSISIGEYFTWIGPGCNHLPSPPDYGTDLNAMHEAQLTLDELSEFRMALSLDEMCGETRIGLMNATASQRREAFGITLGLWKEGD